MWYGHLEKISLPKQNLAVDIAGKVKCKKVVKTDKEGDGSKRSLGVGAGNGSHEARIGERQPKTLAHCTRLSGDKAGFV